MLKRELRSHGSLRIEITRNNGDREWFRGLYERIHPVQRLGIPLLVEEGLLEEIRKHLVEEREDLTAKLRPFV